jgi:hypothetical protein
VWGSYINALGASWHPEHFLCAGCGRPLIEAEFQVVENKPYHHACYLAFQAPRCAYCGQPISGQYQKYEGRSYHSHCYREHVAPRCVYCQKPLLREHLLDAWGNKYCSEHQKQYPQCDFCSRLIPPVQQTPGWNAYGVSRCATCRSHAIDVIEQAQPLFQECKAWLARQGFRFNQLPLHLELRDRATLSKLLQGRSVNHPLGVTLSSRQMRNGYFYNSQIEGVAVLQGMPPTLFSGVVLHELGHVWLTVHQIESLPAWAEEGFCQLLSYRYYQSLNTAEARFHAERLESASDPIYGEGFRTMHARSKKIGFARFVEILQTTRKLPQA